MSSGWLQVWLVGLGQNLGRWKAVLWVVVLHTGAIPVPLSGEPKNKRQDLAAKIFLPSLRIPLLILNRMFFFQEALFLKNLKYRRGPKLVPVCRQQPLSHSFVWAIVLGSYDINKDGHLVATLSLCLKIKPGALFW